MDESSNSVISAFSEDQTVRLTGVRKGQLRNWDKTDFYKPSYAEENRRLAYSRIYSFKDIVALRILGVLRNQYDVSLQHLRKVSKKLSRFGDDPGRWTAVNLYVLSKRVYWHEPGTELPQQIVSKQYVLPTLSLRRVVDDTKKDLKKQKNHRAPESVGHVEKKRYINHNAAVVAGTRIPVAAIKRFREAGYSVEQIIQEYPDLTPEDVNAAIEYDIKQSAA